MTMKLEEIKTGVFVNWVANRYFRDWNIIGKIVHVAPAPWEGNPSALSVTILGFDDFKENTVSCKTVMEECTVASTSSARNIYDVRILNQEKAILEARFKVKQLEQDLEKMVAERDTIV